MNEKVKLRILTVIIAMVALLLVLKHIDDRSAYRQEARAWQKHREVLFVKWEMNVKAGMATFNPSDLGCATFSDFYALSRAEQHRILSDQLCCAALRHKVLPITWECY